MTNREFYEMVTLFVNDSDLILDKNELGERLITKANEEIAKLDARNAKRASTPSKKSLENEPIKAEILEVLGGSEAPMTIGEINEVLGKGFTSQKVSALLTQLIKAEQVVKTYEKKVAYFGLA